MVFPVLPGQYSMKMMQKQSEFRSVCHIIPICLFGIISSFVLADSKQVHIAFCVYAAVSPSILFVGKSLT
jgi:hypothetical protein